MRSIGGAVGELKEHSRAFNLDLPGSAFVHGLGEWRIESLVSAAARTGIAAASAAGGLIDIPEHELAADDVPETVMTRGLHEITSLLVTEFTLDDVLRVILETIYRALGRRAHACVLPAEGSLGGRRQVPLRARTIRGGHARLDRDAA